jgi:serine protease inhibitor
MGGILTSKTWSLLLLIALSTMPQIMAQETEPYAGLVDANNRFAFRFFHQAITNTPGQNTLSAPTSLFLDFALLQNGADAAAQKQVSDVFGWQALTPAQINEESAALRQVLTYSSTPKAENRSVQRAQVTGEHLIMSGSLWVKKPTVFRPQFLDINKKFFGFASATLADSDQAAARAISDWASRQTGAPLDGFINSVHGDDFVLVDTTWFKGSWVQPFLVSNTHPGDFTLLSGAKKSILMMSKSGEQEYLKAPKFQAVCLYYWNAEMYVFLPDEDSSLTEFEQSLTPNNWSTWLRQFRSRQGDLGLPKFHSAYRGDTKAVLQDLGVKDLFDSFHSFAPAVTNPEGAKLTRSVSVILLSVDEKGTEVVTTMMTGGVVGGIEGSPPPPFRMIVNRPFFFAICDRKTKAILYMGAIVEP